MNRLPTLDDPNFYTGEVMVFVKASQLDTFQEIQEIVAEIKSWGATPALYIGTWRDIMANQPPPTQ